PDLLCRTPAHHTSFRLGAPIDVDLGKATTAIYTPGEDPIPDATAESQGSAQRIAEILGELESLLGELEPELGQMDAIAGDGDHGKGMVIGSRAARSAAQRAVDRGSGARTVLVQAGAAWSAEAGGTSGARSEEHT